jgi:acid stress-induced BolA-like protein IbaG/YrbA
MTREELHAIIAAGLTCDHLELSGDGRHWYATIVSPSFEGQRLIQRHQKVYAALGGRIQTDEVHALSMKTYTPAEWAVHVSNSSNASHASNDANS